VEDSCPKDQMKRLGITIITLLLLIGSMKAGGPAAMIPSSTDANKTPKLIWNRDLQKGSALPIHSVETIQQENAPFSFELTPRQQRNASAPNFRVDLDIIVQYSG